MVLFSNFNSPEYIIELRTHTPWTGSWLQCPDNHVGFHVSGCWCFSPWRQESPSLCTSSASLHQRRSTHQEPLWLRPAMTPS
uniref:Uncharacterized protein n=1 Tax=Pygocentrus nattereri TaxID=42514 RepID=A0AAR2LDC6_PYGNA